MSIIYKLGYMYSKDDKEKYDAFFDYCNNNLVGRKLRKGIFTSEKDASFSFYNYNPIGESHGHFIIQIDISYFIYNEKYYDLGFQYQNESLKLNCARTGIYYNTSEPEEIQDIIPVFRSHKPSNYRLNGPRTRGYVSMSRKEYSVSKLPINEFSKKLFDEFSKFINIVDNMKISFENMGCQFIS